MLSHPSAAEKVILVHVEFSQADECEDLSEFRDLVRSTGVDIVEVFQTKKLKPDIKALIGRGKIEEIKAAVATHEAECVLFNHKLTPSQERNLEQMVHARVYDRTRVILDIFAQRAHTFEGKLQVELAQLKHLKTRLIRGWTHLERQKGGIGLRGPGETQLETDRRLINVRIKKLTQDLAQVRKQRAVARRARQKAQFPTLSLIGYTNAGKSTLFNRLTNSEVYVADQLFATLDPTIRKIRIPAVGTCILSDTVGFIRHLPHSLVDAFRATLEETKLADLLLHVVDASDPDSHAKIEQVNAVLDEIGAADIPQLMIFNKIDLSENKEPHFEPHPLEGQAAIYCSAITGEGLGYITEALTTALAGKQVQTTLTLPSNCGDLRNQLYKIGNVLSEEINDEGEWVITLKMGEKQLEKIKNKAKRR